jgi:hypothetical protein
MRLFEGIRTLRWQSWDGTGLEHCTIRSDGLEFLAEGVVIMPREDGAALRYALRFDGAWRTQSVSVAVLGREESIHADDGRAGDVAARRCAYTCLELRTGSGHLGFADHQHFRDQTAEPGARRKRGYRDCLFRPSRSKHPCRSATLYLHGSWTDLPVSIPRQRFRAGDRGRP